MPNSKQGMKKTGNEWQVLYRGERKPAHDQYTWYTPKWGKRQRRPKSQWVNYRNKATRGKYYSRKYNMYFKNYESFCKYDAMIKDRIRRNTTIKSGKRVINWAKFNELKQRDQEYQEIYKKAYPSILSRQETEKKQDQLGMMWAKTRDQNLYKHLKKKAKREEQYQKHKKETQKRIQNIKDQEYTQKQTIKRQYKWGKTKKPKEWDKKWTNTK